MNLEGYSDQFIEYYNYHKKYTDIYGDNTIILLQNGGFYEIYSHQLNDDTFMGPNIYELSQIANLSVTRKDKSKALSKSNVLMSGTPTHKKLKYCSIYLNHNYHVIIVEQVTEPPKPVREVTEILSPGTNIIESEEYISNNSQKLLMSIFIEKNLHNHKEIFSSGISFIDVSTGKSWITNTIQSYTDENFTMNEIKRILSYYNPVEILIHTENFTLTNESAKRMFDLLNINLYIDFFKSDKTLTQKKFQNDLLTKVFKIKSMNSSIEELNLELKEEVLLSYIYLLKYISEHRENLINSLERPLEINNYNHLLLTADSVRQLSICNNYSFYTGTNRDLISLLNKCSSPIGKRLYKLRILNPLLDINEIQKRYDIISLLINDNLYKKIRSNLSRTNDYEKSLRKMNLNYLNSTQLYSDYISYEYLNNCINLVNDNLDSYSDFSQTFQQFTEYYNELTQTFCFDNFSCYMSSNDINKSIFNVNLYPDIDELEQKINKCLEHYDLIIRGLSKIIDPKKKGNNLVKRDYMEKFNHFLQCTKTRTKTIEKYLDNKRLTINDSEGNLVCQLTKDNLSFKARDSSNNFIVHEYLTKLSNDLTNYSKSLNELNKKYYNCKISELHEKYNSILKKINEFIGDIDCHSNNAFVSIKNNYFKPELKESDKSFVNIKGIRHPLAEQIDKSKEFIKNDIHLGSEDQSGILLYGLNSAGKSTTAKAIALSLVMAQSGCFVPADNFIYFPYNKIFTRILNNDKMWSGLSSFAVECKEISHIVLNADKNSFVIGDEIFSSTESDSAISLVNGVIHKLHEINCSYIFATHFHELVELKTIKELIDKSLKIYHLSVRIEDNILYFDRILKSGNGPTDYGIMVGESMGLPNDIINIANTTKKSLKKKTELISNKTSNYNSQLIMGKCSMPGCNYTSEETHHIKEQKDADENGNIGSIHKNNLSNLCPLCKNHHAEITHGKLFIKGYLDTSEGLKLDYEYLNEKKSKNKFDDKQILIIKEYYNLNKGILKKEDIRKKLLSERKINIGSTTFDKIIKEIY